MATEKQIEANRRNAALSMGPKTEEGKAKSRTNAVMHGLTSTVVLPHEQEEAISKRFASWAKSLGPEDELDEFEVRVAVEASLSYEKCCARGRDRELELAEIATDPGDRWAREREKAAGRLGRSLGRNPQEVALQLRSTPAGRKWLIDQWKVLLTAVAEGQRPAWRESESNTALDLMGRPKLLRHLWDRTDLFTNPEAIRALILKEIATLEAQQVNGDAEDLRLRSLHARGLIFETDKSLTLIRRYETAAYRQYRKSIDTIRKSKSSSTKSAQMTRRLQAPPVTMGCENYETNPFSASGSLEPPIMDVEEPPDYETNPISEGLAPVVEAPVLVVKASPEYETKPIPTASPPEAAALGGTAEADLSQAVAPKPQGNRKYRRYMEKRRREQERMAHRQTA